jgi:hypothetical protein
VRGIAHAVVAAAGCMLASAWVGGLTSACELTLPGDDGGTDAGSKSDVTTQTQTIGDQCTAVFTELCTQAINRCGESGFTLDQCINADLPTCCIGSQCNQVSQVPSSTVSACTAAIDNEDCNLIATSNAPAECTSFVMDQ